MLCEWKNTAHPDGISIENKPQNLGDPLRGLIVHLIFFVGSPPTLWQTIKIKICPVHITEKKVKLPFFYRAIEKHKKAQVGDGHVLTSSFPLMRFFHWKSKSMGEGDYVQANTDL